MPDNIPSFFVLGLTVRGDALAEVTVVDDQLGRLTFTRDMAEALFHLLRWGAPYGTYNVTGSGRVASWAEIACEVFELANGNGEAVRPVTTAEYYAGAEGPVAPRPERSDLDLTKIESTGFSPRDWEDELREYVSNLKER
ncbi:sugar nucleotide-binding protein [Olsenella sp. An188]|uniref:sugar nucleotide-binding protein n=1 Tax=Olsenella sp. An188 TaxID=1965579 RepID=UPI000B37E1CA|nr:sugar nucleotide-binding protein [Olsenella sp. An188]OUP39029.1 hypothetical protein B5F23_02615 [Olsenella sp. An188]